MKRFCFVGLILSIVCSLFCCTVACAHTCDFVKYFYNQDATCLSNGTETAVCERNFCNAQHTRIKIDSAKGHKYSEPVYEWNNDVCTATRVCENDNSHLETETVKAVYVKDTDRTCTEGEKEHYVVNFSNQAFSLQLTRENSVVVGDGWHTYSKQGSCECGEQAIMYEFDGITPTFEGGKANCLVMTGLDETIMDVTFYVKNLDNSSYVNATIMVYDEEGNELIERKVESSFFEMDYYMNKNYYIIVIPETDAIMNAFPLLEY